LCDLYIKIIIARKIRDSSTIDDMGSIWAEHAVRYNITTISMGIMVRIAFG